jgi:hypothetical protein
MTEKKLNPAPVKLDGWMIGRLDLFAAHALSGMLADPNSVGTPDEFAKIAFHYAQAMMRESKRVIETTEKRMNK